MPDFRPPSDRQSNHSSRMLVYVMLGIIVLFIAAFLVLHPDPAGAGHSNPTPGHEPSTIQTPPPSKLK